MARFVCRILIVGLKVSCAGMFEKERVRQTGVEEGHCKGWGTIHFKMKRKFLIFTQRDYTSITVIIDFK